MVSKLCRAICLAGLYQFQSMKKSICRGSDAPGGYSSGYGSYQGGSVAGSSKTGDTRPFKVMTLVGLLGLGLLAGGVMIYRKTTSGKKSFKGTGRK